MFVDELTIEAKAGNGGDGVVRWIHEHSRPLGGPAGGNGGRGASVFVRAVRNNNVLANYTGDKLFKAEDGEAGQGKQRYGKNGEDLIIDVPMGSVITHIETGRRTELFHEGETVELLKGGNGGLGNEHFKSATNRAPVESTKGKPGKEGTFRIEVELIVDAGFIGIPNAGKSTLLNALTRATSKVGAYPFTTLSPHLGDLYGFTLADIPGLIEGASEGKGLGHTFLRHVKRMKMLLHCVSLENEDPLAMYHTIRGELEKFDPELLNKEEWIVLTKSDLVAQEDAVHILENLTKTGNRVFILSAFDDISLKEFSDELVKALRRGVDSAIIA